jgi:hypothetical protein
MNPQGISGTIRTLVMSHGNGGAQQILFVLEMRSSHGWRIPLQPVNSRRRMAKCECSGYKRVMGKEYAFLMRCPEDLDEPVSVTSRILAYTRALGSDNISSWTEQEIKPVDGNTPFFLIRVAVASQ